MAPPFFTSSPRSELVAGAVLFAMTLGMTLLPTGRAALTGVAIWAGVMAAVVVLWVATPPLRNDSDMWPIDLVFLAVNTGVPILLGMDCRVGSLALAQRPVARAGALRSLTSSPPGLTRWSMLRRAIKTVG